MERFQAANALIGAWNPDRPVIGLRPHAAGRAARWFLRHFPGDVAYAYKANSSVFLLGALYGAGIRKFDVASIPEIEDAATIPGAELHYMHPVKSRLAIRRAFAEFGVRSFAVDSEDELKKIAEETGGCHDLTLWVRVAVPSLNSKIPLERKFGVTGAKAARLLVKARQAAKELGITFHVGSQTATPEAYTTALAEVGKLIAKAGVVLDRLDVGGGFPSIYEADNPPAPLSAFMRTIAEGVDRLPIGERCKLMCEPGRALVAEAESLIVRVDARRGNELFINDGSYGTLFDATHMNFNFPVRLVGADPAEPMVPFSFWGPTCDTVDFMKGPFVLPARVKEGDYIEIGNTGAYGRAIAGNFNGYGAFDEAILLDEPMLTMYPAEAGAPARQDDREAQQVQA
ncbi:MAG TPA: type III PLP-dependent enzyme [Hyphomicrobiaceae bacterium]|nr:type III PLP-dependent enzyme [Hyphomicrobiaceae bacterium]